MKTYAIADLHGRYDLLRATLKLIEEDAGDEGGTFICLGDFVDRGLQARSIIEMLMLGPRSPNWQWIVLQGNHEAMMLECLRNPNMITWWLGNGGHATLGSYGYQTGDKLLPLKVPAQHMAWLDSLPVHHEDEQRIFVHAGVPIHVPLTDAKQELLQWMLYADHEDGPHVSGKHIVHGHHQSASHPLLLPHRINLDSFAWYTGRLAIGVFNDEQAQPERILEVRSAPIG